MRTTETATATVDPTVPLQEQLDLDSMDFLAYLSGVADRTGVEVPERDYGDVAALQGCVDYVAAALARAAGAQDRILPA